jgi:hypothetical protein
MKQRMMMTATLMALTAVTAFGQTAKKSEKAKQIERGAYIVKTRGCNDCHTPLKMGANGPEPDMERALTGHPESIVITEVPQIPAGPWMSVGSATNTAFAGPWGISFARNLTPDPETGLGKWTEKQFMDTMRTGRHLGVGRPVLPPMPWFMIGAATDGDIKDLFAYLQSLKPVKNRVPQPIDPPAAK